ncbi:hypothetical protein MPHL43072_20535 [Mycolicibacterium phlei DSM 43072]|uniref:Uncharacterized protein n=1 Tax=Mycolicibacterium phlei DSM 43239 = CCUG 21000 TaxID=1226750 RepID=A0A5N5V7J4_MYCPH|nr:hypothetical protein MPHL21000_06745 [Mycolicibacterium phlei DSM 43239 = CCUG 21000]KXW61387.1 hypothetical protein MPHL43239_22265 [Mycolicibacterium phlei DSM 43239 = CCUG 21000]KXW64644.1 hypothetical protein MPHL43070_22405 [Mycolicibacterium phlei DSM 43070]KXW69966.1 hypothetical protein MPHL43072_20535 [Mycolicibacterium phlei DSM 43072]
MAKLLDAPDRVMTVIGRPDTWDRETHGYTVAR